MNLRRASFIGLGAAALLLAVLAGLWLARARIAVEFAQGYFRDHGVEAMVEIGALGLSGGSARFALGPREAPELSARIELFFDPLRWKPYLVEVRLVDPVVRAHIDENGKVTLPALQRWLDSLSQPKEKSPYVSDDLVVSFTGLRALLQTPGGALEVDGDARLVKMRPVLAALTMKPGTLRRKDMTARLDSGTLSLVARKDGYRLQAKLAGEAARGAMRAGRADLAIDASGLVLSDDGSIAAAMVHLTGRAETLAANGMVARNADLNISVFKARLADSVLALDAATARLKAASVQDMVSDLDLDATFHGVTASAQGVEGEGDLWLVAQAALPETLRRTIRSLPVLAMDAPLQAAVANNLGPFAVSGKAHVARHGDTTTMKLTAPLTARTARRGILNIPGLSVVQKAGLTSGKFDVAVSGGGLPTELLGVNSFTWDGAAFRASVALGAGLDFAAFKGIDAGLGGVVTGGKGRFAFTLSGCQAVTLEALGPLATKISGKVCPAAAPLFALDGAGWRAAAEVKGVSAFLPLANAQLSEAAAHLSFDGKAGPRGTVTVTAAKVADAATPLRFQPVNGSGTVDLADMTWRGRFAVADGKSRPLGTVTLTHAMAGGAGSAHIEAPLVFAQGGLQPEDLSPLLAPFRKTDGRAAFKGDIAWGARGMGANTGTLATRSFDFLTPMGRAHALDTNLALTSLLPPATAEVQGLKIARIDWTLPFSAVDLLFGFNTKDIKIERLQTDIAEGHVTLAPFALALADPRLESRAVITGLSLAPLIAASNLSGKASLQGKVSGVIPFTAGPEGFRIKDGHLTADGPGRLELKRSLWGEAALTANMAQDFAYQALESLAFESMTADINSAEQGRLNIVFHIKGHSDPPTPQKAEVELPVADILNGSALQRPMPLPGGTPIELTLDTSLNFDELLRSYAEAWSKALNSGGVSP